MKAVVNNQANKKQDIEYWRRRAHKAEKQVENLLNNQHPVFSWLDKHHPGVKKQFMNYVMEHLYE